MRGTPGSGRVLAMSKTFSHVGMLLALLGLCAAMCLLFALVGEQAAGAQVLATPTGGQNSVSQGIRIVEASGTRIVFDVDLSDYVVAQQQAGDRVYDLLSVPGWGLTQEPGMPQLPVRRVLLGVPPDAGLHLAISDVLTQDAGPYRILPAAERILDEEMLGLDGTWLSPPRFDIRYIESPAGYGAQGYQPDAIARLAEVAWLRSQRVAAIDLYPILYNAATERIHFHPHFRVELSFSYARGSGHDALPGIEPGAFEPLLEQELLNYEPARQWRSPAGLSTTRTGSADWPLRSDAYKIVVTEDGLHRLTHDFLLQGGMPAEILATLDPRTLQLYSMGQEIPIQVVGEADQSFDPGDYVLFYGQGLESKYTDKNIYWLTYGQAVGRRMGERNGEPSGALPSPTSFPFERRIEENRAYLAQWPGDDSTERWYWQALLILPGEPVSLTMDVALDNVSTETVSSTLWVSMLGSTATEHKAEFSVNGQAIGEHGWFGNDTVQWVRLDFPQSYLAEGVNTVRVDFPGVAGVSSEGVFFDRYQLAYAHAFRADSGQLEFSQAGPGVYEFTVAGFTDSDVDVYDITEPLSVTRIVSTVIEPVDPSYSLHFSDTVPMSRTYLALTPDRWLEPIDMVRYLPTDLRDPANAADYIIISHADFLQAAQQLATHRTSQGLRSLVVDVQNIYDEFGFGLATPHAIRDLMRYAYQNWQTSYLVLLGDGTYDPKNYLNEGVVSYLTPYLGFVDPWLGETATDNWFVAVSGEDILPDLHLGRLPANTLGEAQVMVDKIIAYEETSGVEWAKRLTFVAGQQPDPKGAGNFHSVSDAVIDEVVPPLFDISRVYLGTIPGSTCATGTVCEQQLVQMINSGTLLVNFIGHGSMIQWESILTRSSIGSLSNAGALPVMLPMTCLDGYFIQARSPTTPYLDNPSLSEVLVRAPGKGAVASWGPTGLGVAYGHDQLNRGFLEALLVEGIPELGPATYAGKLTLYTAGYSLEQIEEYTIFGDPALRIKSPDADLSVVKTVEAPQEVVAGDIVTFTLAFTNNGPGIAFGVTLTDLLPPELAEPMIVYSSPAVISRHQDITFAWAITDLWPHSGGRIKVRAEIGSEVARPSFFNTAVISSLTSDLDLSNNRSRAGIGAKRAWLPLILKSYAAQVFSNSDN